VAATEPAAIMVTSSSMVDSIHAFASQRGQQRESSPNFPNEAPQKPGNFCGELCHDRLADTAWRNPE
jgi:hypothetical protein